MCVCFCLFACLFYFCFYFIRFRLCMGGDWWILQNAFESLACRRKDRLTLTLTGIIDFIKSSPFRYHSAFWKNGRYDCMAICELDKMAGNSKCHINSDWLYLDWIKWWGIWNVIYLYERHYFLRGWWWRHSFLHILWGRHIFLTPYF